MAENGRQGTQIENRTCPLLNKECIKGQCAFYNVMNRNFGGLTQQFGICSFNALIMILSEINQKTPIPKPQGIQLPVLGRK